MQFCLTCSDVFVNIAISLLDLIFAEHMDISLRCAVVDSGIFWSLNDDSVLHVYHLSDKLCQLQDIEGGLSQWEHVGIVGQFHLKVLFLLVAGVVTKENIKSLSG